MKIIFFFFVLMIFQIDSIFAEMNIALKDKRPNEIDAEFSESMLRLPWIQEFRYVAVINKATSGKEAQKIKVYEYGQKIIESKVSTGRDQFEAKGEYHSTRDSWSITPTGYYTPTYLSKNHRSSIYGGFISKIAGGVKMPFAIFFNGDIALHQAPKGTESYLGKKASGGCVRLSRDVAEDFFNRVIETRGSKIPSFKTDGSVEVSEKGEYSYRDQLGYSALIIVINKIIK